MRGMWDIREVQNMTEIWIRIWDVMKVQDAKGDVECDRNAGCHMDVRHHGGVGCHMNVGCEGLGAMGTWMGYMDTHPIANTPDCNMLPPPNSSPRSPSRRQLTILSAPAGGGRGVPQCFTRELGRLVLQHRLVLWPPAERGAL